MNEDGARLKGHPGRVWFPAKCARKDEGEESVDSFRQNESNEVSRDFAGVLFLTTRTMAAGRWLGMPQSPNLH